MTKRVGGATPRTVAVLTGVAALLVCALAAPAGQVLRLHPPERQQIDIGALSTILESESGVRLQFDASDALGDDPLASLQDGSADLALVENTRAFEDGLRVVVNLYRAVVHFSVRQDDGLRELRDSDRPLRVEILDNSHTAALIAELIAQRAPGAGAKAEAMAKPGYERWQEGDPGEPDIQLRVGPISPTSTGWFREGFTLVPLSRFDPAGAEFYIEGIRYLVPRLETTRIPALTYDLPGNEEGIDALAVDVLLVSHSRVPADLIYPLTRTLVEQKPRFVASAPALFRGLNIDFSDDNLAFPIHRGSRQYIERDEPGFLERYAETMNFLVYMTALLITGLVGLARWRARRRKDRIDRFYERVFELRSRATPENRQEILSVLERVEQEAFEALMAERLAADESFRIFMELANGVRRDMGSTGK